MTPKSDFPFVWEHFLFVQLLDEDHQPIFVLASLFRYFHQLKPLACLAPCNLHLCGIKNELLVRIGYSEVISSYQRNIDFDPSREDCHLLKVFQ